MSHHSFCDEQRLRDDETMFVHRHHERRSQTALFTLITIGQTMSLEMDRRQTTF